MRLIAALFAICLAVCVSNVPLAAATPSNTHLVKAKVKQHKVKGHKAPKIKNKQHSRVN